MKILPDKLEQDIPKELQAVAVFVLKGDKDDCTKSKSDKR